MLPSSAQIVKGWPAFISSVLSSFWRGTLCYSLLNCLATCLELPNIGYFFCLFPYLLRMYLTCIPGVHSPTYHHRVLDLGQCISTCSFWQMWLVPSLSHPLFWRGLFYHRLPELNILRSHFCHHPTEFGQMLMNNDNNCFIYDYEMPSRNWAKRRTREFSSTHCSFLVLKSPRLFEIPIQGHFNLTVYKSGESKLISNLTKIEN